MTEINPNPMQQTAQKSRTRSHWKYVRVVVSLLLGLIPVVGSRQAAQVSPYPSLGCLATAANVSAFVDATGSFVIPNVPVTGQVYRVRVICPQPGGTTMGYVSAPVNFVPNANTAVPIMPIGPLAPQPLSLRLQTLGDTLGAKGSTVQLEVQAVLPDGGAYDATASSNGTTYTSSNAAVATVDANGIVTAAGPGATYITASNDGLSATLLMSSFAALDSDGDGMPDAYEIANGLNPFDPSDANIDSDGDGLTNLQEYRLGTNPRVADTDGDGLNDGDEVRLGTNPLVADTDGDGLSDGDEVRLGTNPLVADTDGDGIPDGIEVKLGLNPLVPDAITVVTGHVSNPDGTPSVGTSVTIFTYFNTITDATGAFTFAVIPAGLGSISASAEAVINGAVYAGTSASVSPASTGATDLGTIQLGQSAGQVSGYVRTPDNKPAVGVQITVTSGANTRTAVTDSTGLYSVSGLAAGMVMVAAFDPATSLRGNAAGMLGGTALTLNVQLGSYGIVSGTVRNAGAQPVGAGATVTISGALNATTQTDALGHYSFSFVPLGGVTLDATDANGNHGRSAGTITATAQNLPLDIQYLPRGTVSGVVLDGTNPVAGAAVRLGNDGQISQSLNTTTNSVGQYSFANVYAGTIRIAASNAVTNTGGFASGAITTDGQALTLNVALQPTANLAGTVFHADGTTPDPGATVALQSTALTVTADSSGKFQFNNLPVSSYTLIANDASSSDRGEANATLSAAGATVTQNITLIGLGTVTVTVLDGGGTNPVAGAQVSIDSSGPLNKTVTGVCASDGTVTLSGVLAGNISAKATGPSGLSGLSGSANGTLTAGGTASITVKLLPAGTISGVVYKADAKTPVAGVYVNLDGSRKVLTDANGAYTFTTVPAGNHFLLVTDAAGNQLAANNSVTVSTQGQTVTANFVIVGLGTVAGTITNADGSAAAGIPVQVISFTSGDNAPYGTQSDAHGNYIVAGVPDGNVEVIAQQHTTTTNSYGFALGTVAGDGLTTVINVQLSSSLIPATLTLNDANGEAYPIRETGALIDGAFNVFAGDSAGNEGGSVLSLVQNGTETKFTGEEFAPVDQGGRQISITQTGFDGLNVTRRVYVPQDGYFARYVELLSNPGSSDITVDVKLTSNFRQEIRRQQTVDSQGNAIQAQTVDLPHILLTSSGDNILNTADPNTPDNWVTLGGPLDDDPFVIFKNPNITGAPVGYRNGIWTAYYTLPAIADVFDGPGARLTPTSSGYASGSTGNYAALTETYAALRIPAGATVSLLHFIAEENAFAGANASATRLVQLPPESLVGLTSGDLSSIANFAVPASGVSTLASLGSITNAVSGFVYAADGSTPVPGAGVSFLSSDPIFGRLYTAGADGNGAYQFQGSLGGYAITAENYTVQATHPVTKALSPATPGTFPQGAVASAQNLVFTNTATLTGTVSRGPVVLNTAGTVTISGGSFSTPIVIAIAADGTFTLTGVPVDTTGNAALNTYTLTAAVTNTLLTGTTTAVVSAGATVQANITIGGSGSLTGLVKRPDGSLAINDTVYLHLTNGTQLSAVVDTSGHYIFTDLPVGVYVVSAYDQQSNSSLTVTTNVAASATTTQDLALQSAGVVNGTVTATDGSSVAGLTVTLTSTTSSGSQVLSSITNSTGGYTVSGVQPGSLTAHVTTPAGLQGTGTGSLPLAGQTVTVNITLTAAGTVTGTVYQADGKTAAPGIPVTISPAPLTGSSSTTTDTNGIYTFQNEPIGGFTVNATNPVNGDHGSANGQIQTNGQLRTVNVILNGFGNLTVKVVDGNNNAFAGATITFNDAGTGYTATSDSTGSASFTQLPAGSFGVFARDPATGINASGGVTITANATATLTLSLQAVGTVSGTVYNVDGVTPVAGATVQLNAPYGPSTTSGADGTYKFVNQAVGGSFAAQAVDPQGLVRANSVRQILQTVGQTLTLNLTYVAVGSVSGVVTNLDGTRAENLTLSVVSQNAAVGGTQQVSTGGDGTYSVAEVPIGNFTVTVQGLPVSEAGFGRATIASNGDQETVNIQITSSTVTLPTTLTDGDGYPYEIATDGTYINQISSTNTVGNTFYATQGLSVIVNGTPSTFANGSSPTTSIQTLSGQGIEISMPSLAGLSVTRKIYVPSNGYFARRLDLLTNPNSTPMTVQVREAGGERYTLNYPVITATSNGTTTVGNSTLWAVTADGQKNLPYPRVELALADVFGGTGAPTTLNTVSQSISSYTTQQPNGYGGYNYVTYSTQYWTYLYSTVTIPPNSTVGFLLFTAQEATAATGASAAARLEQLPAEALSGLTPTDLSSIVNFVVPSSPLPAAATPSLAGPISGHVYTGDGAIIIPSTKIYEQSTDLLYGSSATTTADATGAYTLPAVIGSGYAVQAFDTTNSVTSDTFSGTITAPQGTATTQDILFTNTGILQGNVQPTGQTTFASGYVSLSVSCANYLQLNCIYVNLPVKSDGTFTMLDVPSGQVYLQAAITSPQGATYYLPQNGNYIIQVPAKQTTQFQFVLPPTGNITGKITNADGTGAASTAVSIYPSSNGSYASTTTDANGNYSFSSITLDTYTVTATDPSTKDTVTKATTVTQDTTQTVNLQFVGKGTINITVKFANGNIAANVPITISTSTASAFTSVGYSDGNGLLTINNVPVGAFTIRAQYPNQNFVSTTTGSIASNGQTLSLPITLTPVGIISGTVTYGNGTAATGQYVSVQDQVSGSTSYFGNAQTDSAGAYAVQPVPADRLVTVSSSYYDSTSGRTLSISAKNQQVPGDGQTLTVNLRYPGVANVAVTVQNADGTKVTSGGVTLKASDGTKYSGSLGSSGVVTLNNVIEGSYVAYATSPYTNYAVGSTLFTIQPSDDGSTVQVMITTSPQATIQGQVYAADGKTKLNGNYYVSLTDVDTGISNYTDPYDTSGYQFQNVQVGASGYSITAQSNNNSAISQTFTGKVTTQGQTINQDFVLPISAITGTVFLYDGVTPATGVNVTGTIGTGNNAQSVDTSTDSNGNYMLTGLGAGTVSLVAQDSQGVTGTSSVVLTSPTQVLSGANISLEATGTVTGTIYDSNGQPVTNTDIYITSSANNSAFQIYVSTDDSGNYIQTDIPVGTITVTWNDSSSQAHTATGTLVNNGDTVVINIGVSASSIGVVFGTVYDSNGDPSSGAIVTLTPTSGSQAITATTNDQGIYNASGVPVGDFTAMAVLTDGSATASVSATLASSQVPVEVDLGLQDFGNVSGVVTQNGQTLGGAHLVLNSTGDNNSEWVEDSNSDGTYGFGTIPPGTITLQVQDDQQNVIATATGTLPYGGNLTLNIDVPVTGSNVKLPAPFQVRPPVRLSAPSEHALKIDPVLFAPLRTPAAIVPRTNMLLAGGTR